MRTFGTSQRPRILVLGTSHATAVGRHIANLAPTVRFLDTNLPIGQQVRPKDWDAVITDRSLDIVDEDLFVLQFGGNACGRLTRRGYMLQIARIGSTLASEFNRPDEVPNQVAELIDRDLAQTAVDAPTVSVLRIATRQNFPSIDEEPPESLVDDVEPLLMDSDNKVVAAFYRRHQNLLSQWWALPETTRYREQWISAVLDVWRDVDPTRFPSSSPWQAQSRWQVPAEISLIEEQRRTEAERDRMQRQYEARLAEVETRLEEARAHADQHERRLLTAQGQELVDEVIATLREFGFNVVDADAEVTVPGDRREDLRVTDPITPDWIALVEVRGYKKGAQVSDLLRIGRFVTRYVRDTGTQPSASWYVVNQFFNTDPASRPSPLAPNPEEVATFAEDDGLIVDTVSLFELRTRVRHGKLSPAQVRRMLLQTTGVLELPEAGSDRSNLIAEEPGSDAPPNSRE